MAEAVVLSEGKLKTDDGSVVNLSAVAFTQGASVADPTGGVTVDAEARTAINAVISRLEALGLIATV